MNATRLYWNMLVKDPQDTPDAGNILQNVQGDKIVGFSKKNGTGFLSNFHPSTISFEGSLYATVEHAYQASKTFDADCRRLIRVASTPNDAKRLGRSLTLRSDWDVIKVPTMRSLIKEKFKNPFLRHLLVSTRDLKLINENRWNDKFWGMVNGIGENWLGKILEEVRSEIKAEDYDDS